MLFLTAFLWNLVRFIGMAAIAAGGVFIGIALRKRKDAKNSEIE